jgi:hypothetical protein
MNFEEILTKIKTYLANDGYNILGYPHTREQMATLEPWFYPKKKGGDLPPWVGELLNQLKGKYPLASERKIKSMGWSLYYFCGIQADGLTVEQVKEKMLEYFQLLDQVRQKPYNKEAIEAPPGSGCVHVFVLIYVNAVSDETIKEMCGTKLKMKYRNIIVPYLIDVMGKRSFRNSGIPFVPGIVNPKTFDPAVLQ